MKILISPQGTVHCVYSESIDLATLGRLTISRGSYVEPNVAGQWLCPPWMGRNWDLSRSGVLP